LTLCRQCHNAFDIHQSFAKWYVEVDEHGNFVVEFADVGDGGEFQEECRMRRRSTRGSLHLILSGNRGRYPAKALLEFHAAYAESNKILTPKEDKEKKYMEGKRARRGGEERSLALGEAHRG